jgi:nucleoside-diphosphate-sugar epimerase
MLGNSDTVARDLSRDMTTLADNTSSSPGTRLDPGTHVVLGTGQVGRAVGRYLCRLDADVRVVNRSGDAPAGLSDVDVTSADISRPAAARSACSGAAVVYFCLQPPYDKWPERFPPLLGGAIDATASADATFVMADNLYMYGPADGHVHEGVDWAGTTERARTRAEMARTVLGAHEDGRIQATIGRASDFYGPGVTRSIVGKQVFRPICAGGTVWFPGDPSLPHTYTYVPDFARALVTLGAHETAMGAAWHVPNAETLTTRQFVEMAGDIAGTDPTVRGLPSWAIRLLGFVSPTIGQLRETQYQRSEPFVVSHEKFQRAFEFEPTPHREALGRTVEWYRENEPV